MLLLLPISLFLIILFVGLSVSRITGKVLDDLRDILGNDSLEFFFNRRGLVDDLIFISFNIFGCQYECS